MNTFAIFLVLILIVAFLLVVVIMVQNPKGGGLSSSFGGGGGQQMGGVQSTTNFLDKSTWALATLLLVLILLSNFTIMTGNAAPESKVIGGDAIETTVPETVPTPLPNTNPEEGTE